MQRVWARMTIHNATNDMKQGFYYCYWWFLFSMGECMYWVSFWGYKEYKAGMEVKRDSQVVYLGIPLPLKGLVRFDFFETIIQKCIIVLDKMINAKVQQHLAAEVIARKVMPALCYATSVARPTRDQVQRLGTKIFAAAALRQCQTQDAHSLFAEKTHAFDPDCAMVYHNLCFWNRLLWAQPRIISELLQILDRCLPVYKNLLGPVTLLQHDIQELDCQLQLPDLILKTKDGQQISLQDTDKQSFLILRVISSEKRSRENFLLNMKNGLVYCAVISTSLPNFCAR